MTVPSEVSSISYVGSGGTGPFAVPFYFLEEDDLLVVRKEIATGAETTFALTTDYTVAGEGDAAGGSVTLVANLSSDYELHIIRDPDALQTTDYQRNDEFPVDTHERALDKLTMLLQRMKLNFKRAIKAPVTESSDIVISDTAWADRAGKVFAADAGGNLTFMGQAELAALLTSLMTDYDSQTFDGDDATTDFVLDSAPAEADALAVYISGIRQTPGTDYTLASATVTFTTAPPTGVGNVLAVWSNAVAVTTTPADGSVTTPKLAAGALAATAAGLAKMAAGFFQATADGLAKFADGFWQVGGHTKWADGFWAASAAVRAKFEDGIWTFAKIDPNALASQAEAEAGTSNAKLMTPLRVAQAIAALGTGVNSGAMQVLGCDCKNNAGTPDTQFDLDADTIILRSGASLIKIKDAPGAALTNNTATAGPAANGRDQAGAFAAGWVHFYWIAKADGTLATVSSNVAPPTGPTLPTDYIYWAYAGAVYYDGAALKAVRIKGSRAYYDARQTVAALSVIAAEQNASLSNFIPANALSFAGSIELASGGTLALRIVTGLDVFVPNAGSGVMSAFELPNVDQNVIYIKTSGVNFSADLYAHGYKIPNGGE